MNLKFPVIERKSYATLNQDREKNGKELREKLKIMEREERKKERIEQKEREGKK